MCEEGDSDFKSYNHWSRNYKVNVVGVGTVGPTLPDVESDGRKGHKFCKNLPLCTVGKQGVL